jgi:hypothetical protein
MKQVRLASYDGRRTVAFDDRIERFDELVSAIRERASHANVTVGKRWWEATLVPK